LQKWGLPVHKGRGCPPRGEHRLSYLKLHQVLLTHSPDGACSVFPTALLLLASAGIKQESLTVAALTWGTSKPSSSPWHFSIPFSQSSWLFLCCSPLFCWEYGAETDRKDPFPLQLQFTAHFSGTSHFTSYYKHNVFFRNSISKITETFCCIFRTDHQNVVSEWKLRLEVLYFHHRSTEMKPRRKRYEDFWHLCDTPVSAETWYMLDTIRKTKHGVQMAPSEHSSDDHLNNRNEDFICCLGKITLVI